MNKNILLSIITVFLIIVNIAADRPYPFRVALLAVGLLLIISIISRLRRLYHGR